MIYLCPLQFQLLFLQQPSLQLKIVYRPPMCSHLAGERQLAFQSC